MNQISYESIAPLVAEVKRDGCIVGCLFRCPLSNFSASASAVLRHETLGEALAHEAGREGDASLKSSFGLFLRRIFGQAPEEKDAPCGDALASFTVEEERRGVVEAFQRVRDAFAWDGGAKRWISFKAATDLLPEFNQQLAVAPVSDGRDRQVLARMLVEIARADGTLDAAERAFLESFLEVEKGRVDELADAPPLSADELAESGSLAVRETMLMLAWATSLVDGELDPAEEERLEEHARLLSVRAARAAELKRCAQVYLVNQALERAYTAEADAARLHAEAFALAQKLGLEQSIVQRTDVRLRRRLGRI